MKNRSIELHDSLLEMIRPVENDAVIFFSAVIHSSDGEPGRDAGSVWNQKAEMRFSDAKYSELRCKLPQSISEGQLKIDQNLFGNIIPIPLSKSGEVEFEIVISTGETISITGNAVSLRLIGEPKYVEQFSG